jgi:ArsR family transcriptional regulator
MQADTDKPILLADLLATLGEPTRLRIMNLLHIQPLCVCDLQGTLSLSEPLVSRHLARLRFAHLVAATREGNRMVYRVTRADSPITVVLQRFLTDISRKEPCLRCDLERFRELLQHRRQPKRTVPGAGSSSDQHVERR